MIQGSCHCGATGWRLDQLPEAATACNCTAYRRFGTLWAYGFEGGNIVTTGTTQSYIRGRAIEFHFCPVCGCVVFYRARSLEDDDRRKIAVNLRMSEPDPVARVSIDHFDGLDTFDDLPRDGRRVSDYWF